MQAEVIRLVELSVALALLEASNCTSIWADSTHLSPHARNIKWCSDSTAPCLATATKSWTYVRHDNSRHLPHCRHI